MSKARKSYRTKSERALEEIYAEIPRIPSCTGECAEACGPIFMFRGEFDRVKRTFGRTPRIPEGSWTCPMLSPTGKCTVYTMRPYICRLWGTTPALRCPKGCEPDRWLTTEEAHDIFRRIGEVAGPETVGTKGSIDDLWAGFALEAREGRMALMERIRKAVQSGGSTSAAVPAATGAAGASTREDDDQ